MNIEEKRQLMEEIFGSPCVNGLTDQEIIDYPESTLLQLLNEDFDPANSHIYDIISL